MQILCTYSCISISNISQQIMEHCYGLRSLLLHSQVEALIHSTSESENSGVQGSVYSGPEANLSRVLERG